MSASVEFHVLESADESAWLKYICELTQSLHARQERLVIQSDEPGFLVAVDEKLWTYHEDSFIPHERITKPMACSPNGPVLLTSLSIDTDTLIYLGLEPLTGFINAKRIIDVIDANPKRREAGRQRFASYRKLGISPQTIKNPPNPAAKA